MPDPVFFTAGDRFSKHRAVIDRFHIGGRYHNAVAKLCAAYRFRCAAEVRGRRRVKENRFFRHDRIRRGFDGELRTGDLPLDRKHKEYFIRYLSIKLFSPDFLRKLAEECAHGASAERLAGIKSVCKRGKFWLERPVVPEADKRFRLRLVLCAKLDIELVRRRRL